MSFLEAQGPLGKIAVDENWVTITRMKSLKSVMTHGFDGEKKISMASITGVQFKSVGGIGKKLSKLSFGKSSGSELDQNGATGYIQLMVLGSQESKGGLLSAHNDENTVVFNQFAEDKFAEIRNYIEARIVERNKPTMSPVIAEVDVADQILKLSNLLKEGILTQTEFDTQKAKILSR